MNTLVAYSSRHGSTAEIAEFVANVLRSEGLDVDLMDAKRVGAIDRYDAVIIGSAIYIGQWQADARDFVKLFSRDLKQRQVYLFTSGPIGTDPFPKEEPPATPEMIELSGAVEHQSFSGKLDRSVLGVGDRIISRVVRAPEGDFRDWDEIRAWATGVAKQLVPERALATGTAG